MIVLAALWMIAIVPFVALRQNTWFGRPLSDQQTGEYLHSDHKPRLILHALGQIGQRMERHDPSVTMWYADLVRLSTDPLENVRAVDARVMGEAANVPDIRQALLHQLQDESRVVRLEAAFSLARVSSSAGRQEIVAALKDPSPSPDTILRGLTALGEVGNEADIALVESYETPDFPERTRQQARATENAIRAKAVY
jgi:HEAT repeats